MPELTSLTPTSVAKVLWLNAAMVTCVCVGVSWLNPIFFFEEAARKVRATVFIFRWTFRMYLELFVTRTCDVLASCCW